jgi:hypothetical protein
MRKRITALSMAFALASLIGMAVPAAAADLHEDHQNTYCYGTVCVWHFVNNQTGGDSDTFIGASLSTGVSVTGLTTKVLRNVVHYWVTTTGPSPQILYDANTNNAGKLVLSDYYCKCGCGCR